MYIFERPSLNIKMIALSFALMFLLPSWIQAQTNTPLPPDLTLTPWIGVWTIVDAPSEDTGTEPSAKPVVEISPTEDGKGLNIRREVSQKPDVQEVVIPDGVRRPIQSKNCTGWQSSKWLPEAGLISGSSEIACNESESYSITTLRMIVSPERMIDVLTIKASGQTRIAVRHLLYSKDLTSTGEFPNQLAMAARISISAPWDLNTILKLSKMIDVSTFQAALLEKDTQLTLNPKTLKQLTAANVPKPIIDLLVAQAFPEKFFIEKNGQVAATQAVKTKDSLSASSTAPYAIIYPAYGYGGYYSPYYWSYYSPFWYGYPIYFYNGGGSGGSGGPGGPPRPSTGGQLSSARGYVQITPRDTGRQAVPIRGQVSSSGRSAGYAQSVPSGGGASGAGSSSSGASSGGGYSAGSGASSSGGSSGSGNASPGGYSSGSSSGGRAVPR